MKCYYKKYHEEHKLIELDDIESLERENIKIEFNEFDDISQKINNLKNKIEEEINKINKLYEKAIDDITKSYIKKHEELIKEENNMKEKLKNEVTKIKEKLEIYLSESKNEIKINERINKGINLLCYMKINIMHIIKKMENEEKNIIKTLSYVSKINKTQKNINKLFNTLMKNIKINYFLRYIIKFI